MELTKQPIKVYRGNYIESTHRMHIAVTDNKGTLLFHFGQPERPIFPRSSMKPFQAIPLVETGAAKHFNYSQKELALSCASHSGEPIHRQAVLHILDKLNLSEDALQCGTHIPRDLESYKNLIRSGKDLTPSFSNCSGKHSGMLATAVYMGEEPETYREVPHPVQQRILQAVSDVCSVPVSEIELSVDGCGAPVHRIPLQNAAFGYAKLASGIGTHQEALTTIREAMMAHPEMVAGKNRFDTDIMRAFPGEIIAKAGAEGVQCLGLVKKGIGIAIKIEDGNGRATDATAMKVLNDLGFLDDQPNIPDYLAPYITTPVKNMREEAIGKIEADFELIRG
ncbi:asparaginase [Terrilactibacillus laevilacticus]|uniref:asparaginase n=1 Tax=Terrilactibacillus laevilacticus TaxID=1380157 RepID=UPI001147468F|nr:asparaginase [Terrilactibacillus laevilacticus]